MDTDNKPDDEGGSPADIYAGIFNLYMQPFKDNVKRLSNKQLKRLINALVEYPLNEKEYRPKTALEQDLFVISDKLIQAKYGMILHTMNEADNKTEEDTDGKEVKLETDQCGSGTQEQTGGS